MAARRLFVPQFNRYSIGGNALIIRAQLDAVIVTSPVATPFGCPLGRWAVQKMDLFLYPKPQAR